MSRARRSFTRPAVFDSIRQALLAALLAASPTGAQASEPCIVDVSVEPADPVVGQQVLYRARILRRRDVDDIRWLKPIAFPDVRAEWLPGRAEDTTADVDGERYLVREEHRALFLERPGARSLPGFRLRCELDDGTSRDVEVPAVTLAATEPPRAGRPDDWYGAVGPVHLLLVADAKQIELGQSAQLSVSVRGGGNVWIARDPFGGRRAIDGAEIFRRPTETDTQAGDRLFVRRFFRIDVVPRTEGTLEIPEITLPYYDPIARRYAVARTGPLALRVTARGGSLPGRPRLHVEFSRLRRDTGGPKEEGRTPFFPVALALGAVAAGGTVWLFRRRGANERRRWEPVAFALRNADEALARADAIAEARALTSALEAALAAGAGAAEAERAQARACLDALERIRFAETGERPAREKIDAALAALRRS